MSNNLEDFETETKWDRDKMAAIFAVNINKCICAKENFRMNKENHWNMFL